MHHIYAGLKLLRASNRAVDFALDKIIFGLHVDMTVINRSPYRAMVATCFTMKPPIGPDIDYSVSGGYDFLAPGETLHERGMDNPRRGCEVSFYTFYDGGRENMGDTRFWALTGGSGEFCVARAKSENPVVLRGTGRLVPVTGDSMYVTRDFSYALLG